VTAQICLVTARLVQGFASGGEVGSAALLMMEAAPLKRRGIAMSWQVTSHSLSYIASGIVGSLLAWLLTREQMFEWGWRVPFALGLLIVPAGIYIRSNIDETLDTRRSARSQGEVVMALLNRRQLPMILLTVFFIGGIAVNQYLFTYMTTFALVTLKLPPSIAMLAPIFIGIFGALAGILGGLCADRFGRFGINAPCPPYPTGISGAVRHRNRRHRVGLPDRHFGADRPAHGLYRLAEYGRGRSIPAHRPDHGRLDDLCCRSRDIWRNRTVRCNQRGGLYG
jgi:MFS family permease